jgi:hypothetical protein
MKRTLSFIAKGIVATGSLTLPIYAALAATNPYTEAQNKVAAVGSNAGITGQEDLTKIIGNIINIVLGFLGILLLIYFLYAGFLWMTSGGGEEGKKKAITMMKNAVIGLIIIVVAYALSNFVLTQIVSNISNG